MINIEGYKVFHGGLTVKPINGREPFTMAGDWLYKPEYDCWYGGGRSYPADICEAVEVDRVSELEEEVASREQSGIEEHNEVHYWRDRAKKSESELSALQSRHKEAVELLEAAISNINKLSVCECCEKGCQGDSVCIDNGYMDFSWRHADRYEALKAKVNE